MTRLDRLRSTLAEWERGDFAAGGEIVSPDVVLTSHVPGGPVVARGWAEVGDQLREDVFAQWESYRIEVEELTELDADHVLMVGRQSATGKRSGIEIDDELFVVFRFRGEMIGEMWWAPDRGTALDAAGLSE